MSILSNVGDSGLTADHGQRRGSHHRNSTWVLRGVGHGMQSEEVVVSHKIMCEKRSEGVWRSIHGVASAVAKSSDEGAFLPEHDTSGAHGSDVRPVSIINAHRQCLAACLTLRLTPKSESLHSARGARPSSRFYHHFRNLSQAVGLLATRRPANNTKPLLTS